MYSGLKADLYPVREGDELRQSAFQRHEQVDYGPPIGKVYIHSPEDLIFYKLMYFDISQQSKHSRDIAAILKAKKNELDMNYIEQWATRLGLSSVCVVRLTYSEFNFQPNKGSYWLIVVHMVTQKD
jgi:hypothetical protein